MEEPIYRKQFTLYGNDCDCFGRVKPATVLGFMQETAGEQCAAWHMSWEEMAEKGLFWAITRQTVEVTRLPRVTSTVCRVMAQNRPFSAISSQLICQAAHCSPAVSCMKPRTVAGLTRPKQSQSLP